MFQSARKEHPFEKLKLTHLHGRQNVHLCFATDWFPFGDGSNKNRIQKRKASLQNFWQVPGLCLLLTDTTLNSTCQTSLTSQHNARGTGFSMLQQPGKGLRRNLTSQLWMHPNSFHSQFPTDQTDDCRTNLTVQSLNLIPPYAPTLGHVLVPIIRDPRHHFFSWRRPFAMALNGQVLRWHFQQPQCVQSPTTLTHNL